MAERLQRYLARAGVASRRHAELLITAGRVTVNNALATTLGTKVEPNDLVALDGKLVMPPENVSWYVLYKPAGVVTTLDDPQGRPTVLGLLGSIPTRVFPIGRLDWDAEGALLLTDDGAAAHRLLHPSFQVPRTYLAKVKGVPTDESLARLVSGVRLEDGPAKALEVSRFQAVERNTWLRVTVGEGRPHLVKRLCAAIGHPVVRLFRPHQAGISVAGMQPGELRPLRPEELALIAAVAEGKPVPPMTLNLPARRHGRADEDAESEDGAPRPSKPPRFGRRPFRQAPGGAASTSGGTRPSSRPFARGGPGGGRGPGGGVGLAGGTRPTSARPGQGAWKRDANAHRGAAGAGGPRRPGGKEGLARGADGPRFQGARSPRSGATGFGGPGRKPPGARPSFAGKRPPAEGERPGRPAWGGRDAPRTVSSRGGFPDARRGPPGAGRGPGGRDAGSRDFRPKGERSFSSAGRGPKGAAGRPERRDAGGKDFHPRPGGARGGFSSSRRTSPAGHGDARPSSRGRPPSGGAPGGPRGGPPRGRPHQGGFSPGGRPAGGGRGPPRAPGGGPRRAPQGRRGPPRPRGGGPRSPRR